MNNIILKTADSFLSQQCIGKISQEHTGCFKSSEPSLAGGIISFSQTKGSRGIEEISNQGIGDCEVLNCNNILYNNIPLGYHCQDCHYFVSHANSGET